MAVRDFKGIWIPAEVYLDRRLGALEKIMLSEIDSLSVGDDGCFASNKALAEFCQCSERKVTEAITKLISFGYLQVIGFDGRTRKLKSTLTVMRGRVAENARRNGKNCDHNNTSINKEKDILTNVNISKKKKFFTVPTVEEIRQYCVERQNGIDPDAFRDFYEAKGWMVGKNKMKDWKAAVRTWERYHRGKEPTAEQRIYKPRKSHIEIIDGEEVTVFEQP